MEAKRYPVKSRAIFAFLFVILSFAPFGKSWGQSIFTNPITGTNPNASNPYTTGQTFDANITVSGIGRGTGIIGSNANDRYNASGWSTGALDANDYFYFTLTPNSGKKINFLSFVYTGQASGTGPITFAFRSSLDSYTSNIGTPTATGATIDLSSSTYQNITSSVTFRIYGYSAGAAGGTFSINDFTFNGTVTSVSNTAPTVTTQAATSITTTTAIGNGNITATGGVNPTVRGFCWDLAANPDPDLADSYTTESGSFGTGAFTGSITGLSAETQYKATAYATNTVETGYGNVVTFYTLSTEPGENPTTFTATPFNDTRIDLAFDKASTITNADGYIILMKSGSAPTDLPVDANSYNAGNSIGTSTVAAIINSTSATSASITGLTGGTTYYFTIFPYNWNGSVAATYNYKTDGTAPGCNAATPLPATVATTVTATSITPTSASSGGTGLSGNGYAVSDKGVCYNTTGTPTISDNKNSAGTGAADFTVTLGTLTAETYYYARAYASNAIGTGYANQINFYTLSEEPTGPASNLTISLTGTTTQYITWNPASFPPSGATNTGYLLLRAVAPNVPVLLNYDGYSPSAGANTTIVATLGSGASSYTATGLTACNNYTYKLIPYCYGSNPATYNYREYDAPTSSLATPCALSDVLAANGESASISSLENTSAPLTSTTGAQVWQFTIRDGGASMNDADDLPTIVTGITLAQATGNAVDNWSEAIQTISLFDGTTNIATATVSSTQIVFSGLNINVDDNTSKTLTMRLSLKAPLNNIYSGNLDGDDFQFSLSSANFTTKTDGTSSLKSSFSAQSSTNGQNALSVVATQISFQQQPPATTGVDVAMSPAVTLAGTDIHNNIDRDYTGTITITSTGTLSGSATTSVTAISGIATFSNIIHSVIGTGFYLHADAGSFATATSTSFNIDAFVGKKWDGGAGTNKWSDAANWNPDGVPSSTDFVWLNNDNVSTDYTVLIDGTTTRNAKSVHVGYPGNSHTITLSITGGSSSADALNIGDGTGADLLIEDGGVVDNSSVASSNNNRGFEFTSATSTWSMTGTGKYIHNQNAGSFPNYSGGSMPVPVFESNTTFEIKTTTGGWLGAAGLGSIKEYGNLVFRNAGVTVTLTNSSCLADGETLTVNGNLELINSDVRVLNDNSMSTGVTLDIKGNLTIDNSSYLVCSGGYGGGATISVGGNTTTGTGYIAGSIANPSAGINTVILKGNFNGYYNSSSNDEVLKFTGNNTESDVTFNSSSDFLNVEIDKPIKINSNFPGSRTINITSNGVLNCNGYNVTGSGDFTLSSGGGLKISDPDGINGTTGNATGNIRTTSGTRSFSSSANYTYNGTAAQVTGSGLPTTVNHFTVDNSAGVSLTAASLTTSGNLTINSGKLFNIDYNKQVNVNGSLLNNGDETSLIIKSTASGTGSLIHNTDNVKATIQRYITGNTDTHVYKYHFVSIPLTPANESFSALFYDSYLWDFDETINNWRAWGTPTTHILDETRGYIIYYRFAEHTYEFPGPMNNGDFSPALTLTERGKPVLEQGWNLVPNPYPSALDWKLVSMSDRPNMEGCIYIWPADNDGSGGTSSYYSFVGGVSNPNGALDGTIPIGQSVMVHANGGGNPSLIFKNSHRVHSSQTYLKKTENTVPNLLYLVASDSTKSDQAAIRFLDEATENFDGEWDAYKFLGGQHSLNICSMSGDGFKLSINSLPTENKDIIIPIYFYYTDSANVTIKASNLQSFDSIFPIYFEDKLLDKRVNLREENYIFEHDGDTVIDRFQIRFNITYGIDEHNIAEGKVFMLNGKLNIDIPEFENEKVSLQVLDLTGKTILSSDLKVNGNTQTDFRAATGYYIVRISDGRKQYVGKIFVK